MDLTFARIAEPHGRSADFTPANTIGYRETACPP